MTDAPIESDILDRDDGLTFHRTGHFVYESGDHGDAWLELDLLVADPARLRRACATLAERLRPYRPDLVCGPLAGGALVGQWVAYELGVGFAIAERRGSPAANEERYAVPRVLRPRLRGARVVVVDDAINAGAALRGCVREIERAGGGVVAVAALLVRVPGGLDVVRSLGIALEHLGGLAWNAWPAAGCPLCRAGVPIDERR